MSFNKLQIRAIIIPIITELKAMPALSLEDFYDYMSRIPMIDDFDSVFELLLKEIAKVEEDKIPIIKAMMIELIPKPLLISKVNDVLYSQDQADMVKYRLLPLLKALGEEINYEEFYNYFEDADSIINYDTEKLLEHAVINPETQIDFLDFLMSLKFSDKEILIDSLSNDYKDDNLANILFPILYSDFPKEIILKVLNILAETKSSLAIEAIEYLQDITEDKDVFNECQRVLKILKLAGATKEKAQKMHENVLKDTTPFICISGIPDGHYNRGIIFSRKRKDKTIIMVSMVINDILGVIDSFGFYMITELELNRIILKFAQSDVKFNVTPEYIKYLVNKAVQKTKEQKETMNYEFPCWLALMKDVKPMSFTPEEWVKENIQVVPVNEKILNILFSENYLDKWFFTIADNKEFKKLTEIFIQTENLTFNIVEKLTEQNYDMVWTKETEQNLKNSIIETVYLFANARFTDYAVMLYSVMFDEKIFTKMKKDILKKSVYYYFFALKREEKEYKIPTNIFSKKNEKKEIPSEIRDEILENIEQKWVNG